MRPTAQQTSAVQYNHNLLLSEGAEINSKPQLEIENNDVQCFHGATIGQIDPEWIFYLRSRGLGELDARQILVEGFAAEILDPVGNSFLKEKLTRLLNEWIQKALESK